VFATAVDTSWTLAPGPVIAVAAAGWLYARRWRASRAEGGERAAPAWRAWMFAGGLLLILIALVSPVDRLGEQLASAHMVQHLLLADLASIALILGFTKHILRPVTRRIHAIERRAGPFGHPAFAAVLYVAVMWFWHIPDLYDAALEDPFVHALEHLSYSAAGFLYWWHLLSPIRSRLRLGGMGPIAYMASTKLLVGFLGVLLAFSPDLLWDGYGHTGERWGMSPLTDQSVAGLIMGIEQSLVMGVALAWLFARMLSESEAEDQRAERYPSA
jgi:cytochrome c oxidase assembly factor CtaG